MLSEVERGGGGGRLRSRREGVEGEMICQGGRVWRRGEKIC